MLLYSSIKASQAMTDIKEVWFAIRKRVNPKIKFYVLGVHVCQVPIKHDAIACIKVDYTDVITGFCNPSCIDQACAWNQDTKKVVAPKRIADLFVRKRLASSEDKNVDKTA